MSESFVRVPLTDRLLEDLAALEHEQWMAWSKTIAADERISVERLERWRRFWVPYAELDDDIKAYDRVWAQKVIDMLTTHAFDEEEMDE